MRNSIPIVFIAITLLVGCRSPSTVHTQTVASTVTTLTPMQPMLITTPRASMPDGPWKIGVGQAGDALDFSHHEVLEGKGWSNSVWTTISPEGWKTHPGWFVFIENESRVWAYDGDRLLILDVETRGGGAIYCCGFPCAVPAEVFLRLPERERKEIKTHVRVSPAANQNADATGAAFRSHEGISSLSVSRGGGEAVKTAKDYIANSSTGLKPRC